MNRFIDLSKLGGYPTTQRDLDWLQTSYRGCFAALANTIGDMVIISGMVEAGGEVTSGWVSIAGELVPFAAGAIGTGEFTINEAVTNLTFKDGNSKPVRYERIALFSAGGGYQYANLKRLGTLINIWQPGDVKEKVCDMIYLAANFDVDGYGTNNEKGWRILSKAYPDTAGKAFVNYDSADPDYDTLGDTGGAKTVVLTPSNLPTLVSANHGLVNKNGVNTFTGGDASPGEFDNKDMVNWPGANNPVNKMNPFYVILKLVKL